MKLFYRGQAYNAEPTPVDVAESNTVGQYRGQLFRFKYPRHIPAAQPKLHLTYRGASYQTTETGEIIPIMPEKVEKTPVFQGLRLNIPQNQPPLYSKRRLLQEAAKVHRENIQRSLQHRMEVARAKGDDGLVQALEREMQQFV